MELKNELLDLSTRNSLVRTQFTEKIDLSSTLIPKIEIPKGFRDRSFFPTHGLDLSKISEGISARLNEMGASKDYIRKTVSGLCEALKNAYEHGNEKDSSKLIVLAKSISREKLEF